MQNNGAGQASNRPFRFFASMLIAGAIAWIGSFVFAQVSAGSFPAWAYPGLVALIALLLAADWLLTKDRA